MFSFESRIIDQHNEDDSPQNEASRFFSVGGESGEYLLDMCLGFEPRVAQSRRLN